MRYDLFTENTDKLRKKTEYLYWIECSKMKSILLLLFSLSLASPVFSACASQTQVNIDGFGPVYITTDDWARGNFQIDSNGFTFGGGSMGWVEYFVQLLLL